MEARPFQILSLDGGGIRGVFVAAFLSKIEEHLQCDIASHFDLVTGTSTGGIIALALGMGLNPSEILEFYKEHGPKIFPTIPGLPRWLDPWAARQYARRKFSNAPLAHGLQSVFQDQPLGASKKRLVIPAFNLQERRHKLFKTAHHERFTGDYKLPAWQIAMATAAAPTFFSAFTLDGREFIDGGVWANDPVMVGLTEAISILERPLSTVRILSIGTLRSIPTPSTSLSWGGKLRWAPAVADLMIEAQSYAAQAQVEHLVGKANLLRINPEVHPKETAMDNPRNIPALIAKANHFAEHLAPSIRPFLEHQAPAFTPAYEVPR